MQPWEVIVVGGGLAGLCCARRLARDHVRYVLLEADDQLGGRVRTDVVDGFQLDRGFQVLLTAYPEARAVLDYPDLRLGSFEPGALIRCRGGFHRLVDPWRRPQHAWATLWSPVGTLRDKLRVGRLRRQVSQQTLDQIYHASETTTRVALSREGFSDRFVSSFLGPFLGGVFLEGELATSSRKFYFVFRMFADGTAALPAAGMGAIPQQLARGLPAGSIRCGARVAALDRNSVTLATGERLVARAVVVATDLPAAATLLPTLAPGSANGVTCLYFAAPEPPVSEPILVLNGEGHGPINHLCVPSLVCPGYAPPGQTLVSVTVLGNPQGTDDQLVTEARRQLREWYGSAADAWRHLRTYRIPWALPSQPPPALSPVEKPVRAANGCYVCGDHCDTASIQGAMASGRRAAEAVVADLRATAARDPASASGMA